MLSIITPNLNNGSFLEENIISISQLTIPFEHIVVDGGSTDNSLEIISRYPHVKLLHQKEQSGMYGAIHQGFLASKGDYITWVNSDDRIISEGYKKMHEKALEKKHDLVYSDGYYHYIHTNKKTFHPGRKFGKYFLKHGIFPTMQPAMIFSRNTYDSVGGFDYIKFKICGDFNLFYKIARHPTSSIAYISTPSAIFMKRGDSLGDLNYDKYLQEVHDNKLPQPNIIHRSLFYLSKFI